MNPLLNAMNGNRSNNGLAQILSMLKSGNPEQIAQNLIQKNPQFKAFMETNKGKTPEQVARENGLDFSQIKNML